MIHNKYFEVLGKFLGDYDEDIYGRDLVGKVSLSQKNIALTLKELEEQGILRSKTKGSIKFYQLNREYQGLKDVLLSVEIAKKVGFFSKHRKIAHLFKDDQRIIGIFGSYAKGTSTKTSDVDVFIIGKPNNVDYELQGKLFDIAISVKYFSEDDWIKMLKSKNNLCKAIIINHIIIFGAEKFISLSWRYYYGYD